MIRRTFLAILSLLPMWSQPTFKVKEDGDRLEYWVYKPDGSLYFSGSFEGPQARNCFMDIYWSFQ